VCANQAYKIKASRDNPPIVRPKVLIVTGHPSIGAALETVLRLEERYDIRRAARLVDGAALAASWPADVGLVDGVLLGGASVTLGMPALVLSGTREQGEALASRLDDGRGWLPKDVAPDDLVRAIDAVVGDVRAQGDMAGTIGLLSAVLVAVAAVGIVLFVIYRLVFPV
jgi:DNA-binding NarL/FixJ family response regulator